MKFQATNPCPICHGKLWVCEAHPFTVWPDCPCGEPGIPCDCNIEQRSPPGFRTLCPMPKPDIQEQLKYRTLARLAVFKRKELTDAGRLEEAEKVAREVLRLEAEWRKHGGTGDLT